MRARIGERGGGGEPDAAAGAGDQRTPAVEAERRGGGQGDAHAVGPIQKRLVATGANAHPR